MNRKQKGVEERLSRTQDEYFEVLHKVVNNNLEKLSDKNRGYVYWWEHLKHLQRDIMNVCFLRTELGLEEARQSLERAFTPRLKKLLKEKIEKDMEESNG